MASVQLGFKAFDPHELLCHFVAVEAGLYRQEKLHIELIDITFTPETELTKDCFQASCGAALSSALKGIPQKVLLIAVDKPMFWLYARQGTNTLQDMNDKTLATYPAIAPPHHLANIILKKANAESVSLHPARDDVARLGLLRSQHVDAAVLSSALAPPVIEQMGFNTLCFFGDKIRLPTTGLAVDESFLQKEAELSLALVNSHKQSLRLIQEDQALLMRVLNKYFDVADAQLKTTASLYQGYYTNDGTTSRHIAQSAIDSLATSLGLKSVPDWNDIYKF